MTNPMPRRSFLAALGTGALGASALLSRAASATPGATPAGRLDRIGLELYAVRKAMKENPEKTLAAIRAIGYTDVELLWSFKNFDRSPQQVKATLKAEGLTATSAHMAPETLLSEWSESLRTAKLLGHQYLVVPSLPSETKRSINAWKIWTDRFNVAGEEARRAGIWLAFHNEPDHLRKVAGAIPLLRPLRDSLAGDKVRRVLGIVNGTTNFILSAMDENGADYADVLAEAQALGYAEADPTADVEGYDAAAKAETQATAAWVTSPHF